MPLAKSKAGVVPPELVILPVVPETELTLAAMELVTVVEKFASLPKAVANSTKVFKAAGAAPTMLLTAVEAAVSAYVLVAMVLVSTAITPVACV